MRKNIDKKNIADAQLYAEKFLAENKVFAFGDIPDTPEGVSKMADWHHAHLSNLFSKASPFFNEGLSFVKMQDEDEVLYFEEGATLTPEGMAYAKAAVQKALASKVEFEGLKKFCADSLRHREILPPPFLDFIAAVLDGAARKAITGPDSRTHVRARRKQVFAYLIDAIVKKFAIRADGNPSAIDIVHDAAKKVKYSISRDMIKKDYYEYKKMNNIYENE